MNIYTYLDEVFSKQSLQQIFKELNTDFVDCSIWYNGGKDADEINFGWRFIGNDNKIRDEINIRYKDYYQQTGRIDDDYDIYSSIIHYINDKVSSYGLSKYRGDVPVSKGHYWANASWSRIFLMRFFNIYEFADDSREQLKKRLNS